MSASKKKKEQKEEKIQIKSHFTSHNRKLNGRNVKFECANSEMEKFVKEDKKVWNE